MEVTLLYKTSGETHQITCTNENEMNELVCALFGLDINKINITLNCKPFVFTEIKHGDLLTIEDKQDMKEQEIKELENTMKKVNEMIYVNGKHREYSFGILLDSGAQSNFMSYELATFLGIDSLIDKSYQGMAHGAGQTKIHGKISNCKVKIGDKITVPINFLIVDIQLDRFIVILGLEFFYAYDCILSFKSKKLIIGETVINFLAKEEINLVPFNYVKERIRNSFKIIADNKQAVELIRKIIHNIINNPKEEKYRKINSNSKLFENNKICLQYLFDIGFSYVDDNNLYFKNDLNILSYIKEMF